MCFQSAKMVVDNDAVPNLPPKWGHSARYKQSFITRVGGASGQGQQLNISKANHPYHTHCGKMSFPINSNRHFTTAAYTADGM